MVNVVFLLLGMILAAFATWMVMRSKISANQHLLSEKIGFLQQQSEELKNLLSAKEEMIYSLTAQHSTKEAELKHMTNRLQEQKQEMMQIGEKLNNDFRILANEILEEKSKRFTEQNKTNLDQILKPLNERIKEFEKKVDETYDKEAQQRFSLKEEVKRLAELNQQISKEANSLTKALKGESKTQGNWGEIILESILERTGLRKGNEYFVQESFLVEGGKRYQPDVIIHYPGDRSIVIDSKVSLTAYETYMSVDENPVKEQALKAHLVSVKNHINELASKNYQDIESIKTLDFVVLFLSVEPAYLLAIQHEPNLWSYAYEKRILLISPTNLIAVLKMIESLWKQEYQNRNVLEIANQGGALYDDFVRLSENLIKLGRKIEDASVHYKDTMKKISEGRGNLVSRVEKLKALGVKAKKNLPESLINRAIDSDNNEISDELNPLPE